MPCTKCKNTVLPRREILSVGITAQPCPVCGAQNYEFGDQFRQRSGGEEMIERPCIDCGDIMELPGTSTRTICERCRTLRRSTCQILRWQKDKAAGIIRKGLPVVIGPQKRKKP